MTITILHGDVFEQLALLPEDSVDCVVTSPPYWGLRDYGVEGQIGMERTLGEHLAVMTRLFDDIRRILKPTGTCWLNYGDCYASTPNGRSAAEVKKTGNDDRTFRDKPFSTIGPIYAADPRTAARVGNASTLNGPQTVASAGRIVAGGMLKPKDLCMIPNRLAIALQDAGWWVRAECIWAKPNPMPESVRDRPATAHEKIFLLTKSARYFYDTAGVRQGMAATSVQRLSQDVANQAGSSRANGGRKTNGPMKAVGRLTKGAIAADKQRGHGRRHAVPSVVEPGMTTAEQGENGRHLKNYEPAPLQVWEIATAAFSEAHFATFPPELVERCLTAGCPPGGTVLDPFGGAGTTAMVADRMGMHAQMIELNPDYCRIAWRRIRADAGLLSEIRVVNMDQSELF